MEGGLLGNVTPGKLYPELEPVAFALTAGQISPVVESEIGFHILRCDEIHPAPPGQPGRRPRPAAPGVGAPPTVSASSSDESHAGGWGGGFLKPPRPCRIRLAGPGSVEASAGPCNRADVRSRPSSIKGADRSGRKRPLAYGTPPAPERFPFPGLVPFRVCRRGTQGRISRQMSVVSGAGRGGHGRAPLGGGRYPQGWGRADAMLSR